MLLCVCLLRVNFFCESRGEKSDTVECTFQVCYSFNLWDFFQEKKVEKECVVGYKCSSSGGSNGVICGVRYAWHPKTNGAINEKEKK